MALCLSVDGDVNAMRLPRGPAHDAPDRGPPPSPLRQSRGAEHVRVDPDAARFEEHLSRDLANVRTLYLSLRDDPRGVDRLERDPEAVRDVHVAPERKDSQGRVAAEESDRGRRDRAVAACDEDHTTAIDQRALREVGRGRALCTGLAPTDIEARGGEQADAVREI